MRVGQLHREFKVALGFLPYLRRPLLRDQAIREIKLRIENREKRFLEACKKLIYDNPQSPYRKLLSSAGCSYSDLEKSIRSSGLEACLETLRDHGVYLTREEFKSQIPICRNGLTIDTGESDFDNPLLLPEGIRASTSGTTSTPTRMLYDWAFISEESANEMLLYETHGLSNAPSAFWLPSLPSISGIHNLLIHLRFRKPPDKWFSQLQPDFKSRTKMQYVVRCSQILGTKVPKPEFIEMSSADRIAIWIEKQLKEKGVCIVKTFASSAIRIVQAAIEKGIDISGCTMFTGGEALTDRRFKYLQSAGVKAFARFVATESGLIAGGCNHADEGDSMHVYTDRMALIQRERPAASDNKCVKALLFTTLSENTPKVLLNTELGDHGILRQRACDCLFGNTGMNLHVSQVRSFDKFTYEGMSLPGSVLDEVIAELIQGVGGAPDDYQYIESQNEDGLVKLMIKISPHVKIPDEKYFANAILNNLRSKGPAANIASHFWKQADTLQIIREKPQVSSGFKMQTLIKR